VDEYSIISMERTFKDLSGAAALKVGTFPKINLGTQGKTREFIKAATNENVALIKSIPRQYHAQVSKVVTRAIASGKGTDEIYQNVKQYEGVTDRRAKFIAEDQTRKIYNGLNAKRMTQAGLDKFQWLHSGGGIHPRPYHLDVLDGQIFSVDDPPVINEDTGATGLPGEEPNCGCTMVPVVTSDDDDDEGGEE
jgi:SPP1 gp7 family putative phage head morphogenesis protein